MKVGNSIVCRHEYAWGKCGFNSTGFYLAPTGNNLWCGVVPGVYNDAGVEIESSDPIEWVGIVVRGNGNDGYLAAAEITTNPFRGVLTLCLQAPRELAIGVAP
jgi:hypothetical protein